MANSKTQMTSEVRRIDGRLHWVHHILDDRGNVVSTVTGPLKVEFRVEDFLQMLAGACVMALPVALTEEVWVLGEELSVGNTLLILMVSVMVLTVVVWGIFYGRRVVEYRGDFVRRVVSTYIITFLVSLALLALFDKAPLDDLGVMLTRAVIVAFPASFAATAVDMIH